MNEELLKQFPVYVDYLEFKDRTGIDLAEEINGNDLNKINNFLYERHCEIYYYLLYQNVKKTVKDKIIERNRKALEESVKLAITTQAQYILSLGNKGLGVQDLTHRKSDGTHEIIDSATIKDKIISVQAFYILKNTSPQLLYGIHDIASVNGANGG